MRWKCTEGIEIQRNSKKIREHLKKDARILVLIIKILPFGWNLNFLKITLISAK